MKNIDIADILAVIGLVVVTVGIGFIYIPAALIVFGLGLILGSFLTAAARRGEGGTN